MSTPLLSISAARPALYRLASLLGLLACLLAAPAAYAGSVVASPVVVQFPATPVGSTSAGIAATVTISGYSGPFTFSQHYSRDYFFSGQSCNTATPVVCSATIYFRPTLPGVRKEALFIFSNGVRIGSLLFAGVGTAPLGAFQPGLVSTPAGFAALGMSSSVRTLALDENGTAYFNFGTGIYSLASGASTPTLLVTNAGAIYDLSIDGAGVLYWGNSGGSTINTYDTVQGIQGTYTLPTSDTYDNVAVDGFGDLFAVGGNSQNILKITASGTTTTTPVSPANNQDNQGGTDSAGNFYIGGYDIDELTAAGAESQISTLPATVGIAADASGTLYVASSSSTPFELAPGSYSAASYTYSALAGDTISAQAVASSGTLYYGSLGGAYLLDRTQNPLAFPGQTINVASATQTVNVLNIGNMPLTYSAIAISGAGFALQTASTRPCTPGITLAAGASCNVAVNFTGPNAGAYTGSIVMTSNGLNNTSTTQTIALTANIAGPYFTTPTTSLAFTPQTIGTTSPAQSVTITNNGYGSAAIDLAETSSNAVFTINAGTCTATLAVGASCTFTVAFSPNVPGSGSGNITVSALGLSTPLSIPVSGVATPVVQQQGGGTNDSLIFNPAQVGVAQASAQTLTATFTLTGYPSAVTPTAAMRYGTSFSAGTLSCTGTGTIACSIPVTFLPQYPGGRRDALVISANGVIAATFQTYGVGQSPLALIQPGVVTDPISSGGYYYNSVVGEDGTAYVLGQNTNTVYSISPGGVVTQLPITGLSGPSQIAIDGAGTLYIAQNTYAKSLVTYSTAGVQGNFSVVPPSNYTTCNGTVGNTIYPLGVAAGVAGDIYVLEILCNVVYEFHRDGTFSATTINPAMTQPSQLAVDSNENVFVSGYAINEQPASGTQTQVSATSGGEGLGVDAAGTLYSGRYGTGGIGELSAANYGAAVAYLDGVTGVLGLGLGPDGTVYAGDYNYAQKIDRSQGSFTFNAVNLTQTATPQTATIYNGGNLPLTLTSLTLTGDPDFTLSANGCSNGLVIQPGAICTVTVNFTAPGHGGTFNGNIAIVTNSLNTTTTSNIALLDTVNYPYFVLSPASLSFGSQGTNSTSPAQTITVTNNGAELGYISGVGFNVNGYAATLGNTCNSIAPGASCTISVTFDPTSATTYNGTGTLYVSGFIPDPTFTVTGTGTASAPAVTFSPTSIAFTGGPGTVPPNQTVTITNSGNATLTGLSVTLSSTNSYFTLVSTTCGTTLAAGASCNAVINFMNTAAGTSGAYLILNDNAANSPQSVPITSNITAAPLPAFSPTSVTFPPTTVLTNASSQFVTLTNSGNANLDNNGITVTGNTSSFPIVNTCMALLGIGQTCQFTIGFVPQTTGALSATVTITDNATPSTQSFTINGTGVAPAVPQAALAPASLTFTATTSTVAYNQSVTLTNSGNATLNISSIALGGANPTAFALYTTGMPCGSTLAAGASCAVGVGLIANTVGAYSASLIVTDNASPTTQTVALSGTVTGVGAPVFTPLSLNFASTPVNTTAAAQTLTFSNTGTAAVTGIGAVTITGASAADFAQTNNCGSSLAPNASCTISVTFTPVSATLLFATVSITDSLGTQTAMISGTGTASPQAALAPTALTFSTTFNTTSAAQTVTLTNAGNAVLPITSAAIASAQFAISANTCGSSLAAGSSCTYSITFAPTSTATVTSTLSVVDSVGTQTVSLSGTGTAAPAPVVTFGSAPSFPATAVGSSSAAQTVTLTNTGNATLNISAIAITGAGAASFSQTNTCGATLAANASCSLAIVFSPTSAATFTAALTITDNAAGGSQSLTLTGAGTAFTDFGLTAPTASQSVDPGGAAVYNINVTTVTGNFNTPVTLSASGLPAGATATFAPAAVIPGATGAPSTLTIQVAPSFAGLTRNLHRNAAWAALLLFPLLGWRRLRRRLPPLLPLVLLSFAALLPLSGCGGGYFGPSPSTYTITVTGASVTATGTGTVTHSTTVTLSIQ